MVHKKSKILHGNLRWKLSLKNSVEKIPVKQNTCVLRICFHEISENFFEMILKIPFRNNRIFFIFNTSNIYISNLNPKRSYNHSKL